MRLLLSFILIFVSFFGFSQTPTEIAGVWQGNSICQIKPSGCHDEFVVYHVKKKEKANEYSVIMNKIVNGAEEDMGILEAIYDPTTHVLEGKDVKFGTHWKFTEKNNVLEGVLFGKDDKQIFRKIKVEKLKD
jgi:hypothetical protein